MSVGSCYLARSRFSRGNSPAWRNFSDRSHATQQGATFSTLCDKETEKYFSVDFMILLILMRSWFSVHKLDSDIHMAIDEETEETGQWRRPDGLWFHENFFSVLNTMEDALRRLTIVFQRRIKRSTQKRRWPRNRTWHPKTSERTDGPSAHRYIPKFHSPRTLKFRLTIGVIMKWAADKPSWRSYLLAMWFSWPRILKLFWYTSDRFQLFLTCFECNVNIEVQPINNKYNEFR